MNDKILKLFPPLQPLVSHFLERLRFDFLDFFIQGTITSGLRTTKEQWELFQIGRRNKPGEKIVTNAEPGTSFHEYGLAFDICFLINGDPAQGTAFLYDLLALEKAGRIGKELGFEWGGDWKIKDRPHFQYTSGLPLKTIKNNIMPQIDLRPISRSKRQLFIERNLGKIFLATEQNGEAYYVNPITKTLQYMGKTPADRHKYISEIGIGISNQDLKIGLGKI